jgi:hypothetical protein
VERERAHLCRDRLRELTGRHSFRFSPFLTRSGRELVADRCARELAESGRHADALELVDALLAAGDVATLTLEEEAWRLLDRGQPRPRRGGRIPH